MKGLLAAEKTESRLPGLQKAEETAQCYWLDPLSDPRWPKLLERHPCAAVFHSPDWLLALRRTYGYRPLVLTRTPPDRELSNGWAFCDVKSWLTGRRLVSLPFSDHCDPLLENDRDLPALVNILASPPICQQWKHIQVRPQGTRLESEGSPSHFAQGDNYFLHKVDLRPSLDQIVGRFHKDSITRKIRRAERERLTCKEGRSDELIDQFYRLLLMTRHRHRIPPQPFKWFRNLVDCMGERSKVRVCFKDSRAIAAMLTLTYKSSMVYKYGCSDARFHNLGGVPYLFLKTIQDAKQIGAVEFDLGRSDSDNEGLVAFKEHLGGTRYLLTYWNYPRVCGHGFRGRWRERVSKKIFGWMPERLLERTGRILYRHIG